MPMTFHRPYLAQCLLRNLLYPYCMRFLSILDVFQGTMHEIGMTGCASGMHSISPAGAGRADHLVISDSIRTDSIVKQSYLAKTVKRSEAPCYVGIPVALKHCNSDV